MKPYLLLLCAAIGCQSPAPAPNDQSARIDLMAAQIKVLEQRVDVLDHDRDDLVEASIKNCQAIKTTNETLIILIRKSR